MAYPRYRPGINRSGMDRYDYKDEDTSEKDDIMENDKHAHHAGHSVPIYRVAEDGYYRDRDRVLREDGGVLLP